MTFLVCDTSLIPCPTLIAARGRGRGRGKSGKGRGKKKSACPDEDDGEPPNKKPKGKTNP